MAVIAEQEHIAEGYVAVEVVDNDVHPSPRAGELLKYMDPDARDLLPTNPHELAEDPNYYDTADFLHTMGNRTDTFAPDGGFPGTDPDFSCHQLMREAGVSIGILDPQWTPPHPNVEIEHARKCATNAWLADVWLSAPHGRWRGSISVSNRVPERSADEIERWASDDRFVQVLVSPQDVPFGDKSLDPIYAAASKHGLPVSTHLLTLSPYETGPTMPYGMESHWLDYMSAWPLTYTNHLMSLIFGGAFERHPNLRVVFTEGAFTWVLPTLWRMDKMWEARRADVPWVTRRPSEYVREHVRFTTQPLEDPEDSAGYKRYLEWLDPGQLLLFSTDYPHWSYDDPGWAINKFPKDARARIMRENATDLYGLPSIVKALDDVPVA